MGHAEGDGPDASIESFVLEAIGLAQAQRGAFEGLGLEGDGALTTHGFIDQQADAFGEALVALLSEELQDGIQEFSIGLVGHVVGFGDGCVSRHPNTKPA